MSEKNVKVKCVCGCNHTLYISNFNLATEKDDIIIATNANGRKKKLPLHSDVVISRIELIRIINELPKG
jgi:hypothetical protein